MVAAFFSLSTLLMLLHLAPQTKQAIFVVVVCTYMCVHNTIQDPLFCIKAQYAILFIL